MGNYLQKFEVEVARNISSLKLDKELQVKTRDWINSTAQHKYTYNFRWLGRPIIQLPQDIVALQEIIWSIKPELIIETGIAHGGSLIFSASMLALLDLNDAIENGQMFNAKDSNRMVLGVDIDIRAHNRSEIEAHPMASRIQMIQGSSTNVDIIAQVSEVASNYSRILVCLDSNHTHKHVLSELEAYAPFTSLGSYCVVFDTVVEDMDAELFSNRPWGPGNNPKTAVWEYLKNHPEFEIDKDIQNKLLITVAPDGFLKRIR